MTARNDDRGNDASDSRPDTAVRADPARDPKALAASIRDYLSALQDDETESGARSREHQVLDEIAQIIARESNAERLMSTCLKKVATLLDLDAVRLYIAEAQQGDLKLAVAHEDARADLPRGDLGKGLDAFRRNPRRQRGPVSIEEVLAARPADGSPGRAFSVLSVPVFWGGQLWGVLQTASSGARPAGQMSSRFIEQVAALVSCGAMRIEGAAREASFAGRIERRNARIVDLYRKLRDVRTDLELKNHALSDAMENIRKMETFKDAFLSSISHEMRTPLTIIRSYVDLLLHYPPESRERETEFLEVIDTETTKLTMHINKILDLTEIRANEVQLQLGVNVVAELARAAIREIETLYSDKRPRIDCTIPEQIPNVIADRERTIQILVDLLDNALKFSPDGASITLAAQESPGDRSGPFVTIWVADRGIGIDAEQQSKIFEQFSQITEAARGKPRGIGLGLPICKAYVERMGGKMWLESEPGHGSAFYMSLPGTRERAGD